MDLRSLIEKYSYIFYSILIQSIGTLSSMFLLVIIAKLQGVENQGFFSQIKGYFDIFLVIGTMGLPQSFIYLINKRKVSKIQVFKFSIWYVLIFVSFFLLVYMIIYGIGLHLIDLNFEVGFILIIALTGYLFHSLCRGIYITYNSRIYFAIFTILPNVFLFIAIVFFVFLDFNKYSFAYLASSSFLIVIGLFFMKNAIENESTMQVNKLPLKNIFGYSGYSFFSNFFISLQLVLCYKYINFVGGSNKDIAYLSSSYYVFQIPTMLLAMLSPLLFNYMSDSLESKNKLLFSKLKYMIGISIIGTLILYSIASFLIGLLFGNQYSVTIEYVKIFSLAIAPAIISRLIMVAIDTSGLFKINTFYSFFRNIILFSVAFFLFRLNNEIIKSLVIGIVVSEYLVGILYFFTLNKIIKV